jgi:ADP-heptose:LPS heptosyltransferase
VIYVLVTLLLSPLLRSFERQPAVPPQRILVIQVAKIGDAICTTPLLRELQTVFPMANITIACAALTAPLFRANPHVSDVLTVEPARLKGLKAKWHLASILRDGAFDMAICCNAGATWPVVLTWATIQRRIGILPNYSGATTQLAGHLWTKAAVHRSGRLVMETYLDMLPMLTAGPNKLEKQVFAAPGADAHVSRLSARETSSKSSAAPS